MRPFNMIRAAFWLLAVVVVGQLISIMAGSGTCYWIFITGLASPGACAGFTSQAREMWSEVLAAILALLLAARGPPPPPPPPHE
jgi:hypothetical protein